MAKHAKIASPPTPTVKMSTSSQHLNWSALLLFLYPPPSALQHGPSTRQTSPNTYKKETRMPAAFFPPRFPKDCQVQNVVQTPQSQRKILALQTFKHLIDWPSKAKRSAQNSFRKTVQSTSWSLRFRCHLKPYVPSLSWNYSPWCVRLHMPSHALTCFNASSTLSRLRSKLFSCFL